MVKDRWKELLRYSRNKGQGRTSNGRMENILIKRRKYIGSDSSVGWKKQQRLQGIGVFKGTPRLQGKYNWEKMDEFEANSIYLELPS